ncbi:MAG: DUF805 domain-containing protein [Hyphomonadaceae bacterium]
MADVFISYAREDRVRAEQVARGLQACGFEVFFDQEVPPGQSWADFIEAKLRDSKAMVVLWSAASAASQWVREEARLGRDRGKLIPATLDATPAPFGFGEVQAANLTAWSGQPDHGDWRRFVAAIEHAVGRAAAQTAQPVYAGAPAATAEAGMAALIKKCLRLYANGKGRARRKEYWSFALFSLAVVFAAAVLDGMWNEAAGNGGDIAPVITGLALIALAAPQISVSARRLHDLGLNGWLYLVVLIPYLGWLALFIATLIPGQPRDNQYGPNPKAA